jgi:iron complex transport system substrate-binding protein
MLSSKEYSRHFSLLQTCLFLMGWGVLLFSCTEKQVQDRQKTTVPLDFATGFQLYQGEGFWEIEVSQGYAGSSDTYRYLVLDSGVQVNRTGYDAVVQLPIDAVVLTSTTQVPHLDALGKTDLLIGFPQTDLISSSSARARIAAGKVKELGAGPSANPELVLELQPDWIMISTLGEDLRYLDIFKQAGIPALINGEYVEQNPLGRAEWIKFTGVLLGNYPEALAQFEQIKKDYYEAERLTSSLQTKELPTVLSGVMYQDIWYAPGGGSWAAQLLEKAGGSYVFGKEGAGGDPNGLSRERAVVAGGAQ